MAEMTRRDLMRAAMVAGVAGAIGAVPQIARADAVSSPAGASGAIPAASGVLRFAHLTDMHVLDRHHAEQGYAAALRSLDAHQPAFIITGGDHVMDAGHHTKEEATRWFDLYEKTTTANTKLPTYPCIGNHDVFGLTAKVPPKSDPMFGKAMALDRLKMKKPYYSFDQGGWHFVILDNILPREPAFVADFDPEQWEWLKVDLAANKLPAVVVSHVPIVSVTTLLVSAGKKEGEGYAIDNGSMHRNSRPLVKLLAKSNVKLCLSGHIHQVDEVDFLGIKFCCNGAVSGRWWQGPQLEFAEGYAIVDLHPDGKVENRYVDYGWKAQPDPKA